MKKLTYKQSEDIMRLIAMLTELNVLDMDTFLDATIDMAHLTNMEERDYLTMLFNVYVFEDHSS